MVCGVKLLLCVQVYNCRGGIFSQMISNFLHSECGHIENCADIRCTNITDHTCFECESYNGPGLGEAGYINLIIECQRMFPLQDTSL